MMLCRINLALALTILCAATTAMICVFPAGAQSVDNDMSPIGTEIGQAVLQQQPASNADTPVANTVRTIPLSKLSMTRDRPIFSPSRRPPPLSVAPVIAKRVESAKPAEPESPPFILVGTVSGEDSGIAVLVEQSTENTVRLRVNESHQGWTLRSIQGREVTLLKSGKSNVLALAPPGGTAELATAQAALSLESTKRPPRR